MLNKIIKFQFSKSFNSVYIVASKRTPITTFNGNLSNINAPLLSSHAIKACLKDLNLKGDEIDEVLLGNVC